MNTEQSAQRLLELSEKATEGPFYISNPMGSQVWKDGNFLADFDNGTLPDRTIRANATWFIESRTLAPEIARAYLEQSKEIERLREWIREEGVRTDACTFHVLNEICDGCRCGKSAALSTLKEKVGRAGQQKSFTQGSSL